MTRKKRKQKKYIPVFVFTLETITIAQKAMRLFEQSLGRVENQAVKVEFAAETMQQVNGKLEAIRTSVGLMCLTTFDYNEKIVLAAAVQLYILDLLAVPFDTRRQRELQQCWQIEQFALDHPTIGPGRTIHD
jgi:hypothetical protein